MSTNSTAYPFSCRVLFFQWLVPGTEGWEGKKQPSNNAMWSWLIARQPWKMGNKFLRVIPHSSSPLTSCAMSASRSVLGLLFRWRHLSDGFPKDPHRRSGKKTWKWLGNNKHVHSHLKQIMFGLRHQNNLFCVVPGVTVSAFQTWLTFSFWNGNSH